MGSDGSAQRLMENSPQLPQGFYPTDGQSLWPGVFKLRPLLHPDQAPNSGAMLATFRTGSQCGLDLWYQHSPRMRYLLPHVRHCVRKPVATKAPYTSHPKTITAGDALQATCLFDSSNETRRVSAGPSHTDEMCNLYLMTYSSMPVFVDCNGGWVDAKISGPGGVPAHAELVREAEQRWPEMPPARAPGTGPGGHGGGGDDEESETDGRGDKPEVDGGVGGELETDGGSGGGEDKAQYSLGQVSGVALGRGGFDSPSPRRQL